MRKEAVTQNFVHFYSPGTFVAEETRKPIPTWDVDVAMQMARDIRERYGATPYGFRFSTRTRATDDLDSKESARSGVYYLGGRVETLVEIERCADARDTILIANMKANGCDRIIRNTNSWQWTQPLWEGDVVLDYVPPKPDQP